MTNMSYWKKITMNRQISRLRPGLHATQQVRRRPGFAQDSKT